MRTLLIGILISLCLFTACSDDEDNRKIEPAKIVAIKLNDLLYTNDDTGSKEVKVVMQPGTNLEAIKTEILVSNGELVDFVNNEYNDVRKPFEVTVKGEDGEVSTWTLIVQSPPKLVTLSADNLTIPKENIHAGESSIIVSEVDPNAELNAVKVYYEFMNGTLANFTNGEEKDYSNSVNEPFVLEVLGVDEATVYKYNVTFTSEKVGPASVSFIKANGIESDSVVVLEGNVLQPYYTYLTDFTAANVEMGVGFGCTLDPSFSGVNKNMYNDWKVKVTGSNGVETEFTVKRPLLKSTPVLSILHEDLGFAANAGSSAGFSGDKILIATHQMVTGASKEFGIHVYGLDGAYIRNLSRKDINFDGGAVTGVRKMATDADGKILGVQLGAGAGAAAELKIFKWNSIDDENPTAYITYSQQSLGLAYAARSAGINITGSLDGDAIIVVPIAQKQDVLVWTVAKGVLNPTPKKLSFPYAGTGYYYSVEAFDNGFVGAASGNNFNGVNLMNSTLGESFKTNAVTTDIKTYSYKGRKYAAYVAISNGKHVFRVLDLTVQEQSAVDSPIMNIVSRAVANGNNTIDADFAVINGKLHVLFFATNDRVEVYKLEQ